MCVTLLTAKPYAGPSEILTIYDRKTSTLLDVREMDDYDDDEISLRTSLLAKCVMNGSELARTGVAHTRLLADSPHRP